MAGKHTKTKPLRRYTLPAHPATAPAVITLALALLVVGLGWLNRGEAPGEERLAVPLASGAEASSGDEGDDDRVVWPWASVEEGGRTMADGRPFVTENWLDIPLVAPALVLQPGAVGTLIPGTAVAPGTATGTIGLVPGSGTSRPGSGGGTGSEPGTVTTVTARPGGSTPGTGTPTTAPPTTEPPATTPTTEPPTTAPPTTEPPTTPTTEPPTTAPPTTEPPADPPPSGGGLLDTVDDLLGGVVGGVGGVVGGLGGALGLRAS